MEQVTLFYNMEQAIIFYNLLLLIAEISTIFHLSRLKGHSIISVSFHSLWLLIFACCGALLIPVEDFGKIQLLSWAFFLHCPLYLLSITYLYFNGKRSFSLLCASLSITLSLVGIYAFLLEPHRVEVTRTTIQSNKLQHSIRIAVIADLQTDQIRSFEKRIFELIAAENPDAILFCGDYLQISDRYEYLRLKKELNTLLRNSHLNPPFGIFAVQGNVDLDDWGDLFRGLPVTTFETSHSRDLGPLVITGLTLRASGNSSLIIKQRDKFQIVFGHMPNFSLGEIHADLLLAGHTHGGQVKIPFFGPLLTFSKVPRSWASGLTVLAPQKHLYVSRGLGMERGNAPRLRFNCRPEILLLDLIPEKP